MPHPNESWRFGCMEYFTCARLNPEVFGCDLEALTWKIPNMDPIALTPKKTHHPYRNAFTWGGIWLVVLTAAFALAYGHFAAEGFGRFLGMTMVPAAICGYFANRSKIPWSFWKMGGLYAVVALMVLLISSYGAMHHS